MSKSARLIEFNHKAVALTNTILSQLEAGRLSQATSLLFSSPFPFPFSLYSHLFQVCASNSASIEARKIESHLRTFCEPPPIFLLNRAVEVYGKCGCLRDARALFDELPHRNGGSWNAIITAYAQSGYPEEVFRLFIRMNRSGLYPNEVTFASVLGSCSSHVYASRLSTQIHGLIVKYGFTGNVILASSLVDLYAKYGNMSEGRRIFDNIESPSAVSWNIIIRRYLEAGDEIEAIRMFFEMVRLSVLPLNHTFSTALVACSGVSALKEGVQIHGRAIKIAYDHDQVVLCSLIDFYVKCASLENAKKMFDQSSYHSEDVISWTCMVSGFALHGRTREARELFDRMPNRNVISWNAMLAAYTRNRQWEEALEFIFLMRQETDDLDHATLGLILNMCSGLSDVELGKQVHGYLYRLKMNSNTVLGNALLDMYGKCGCFRSCKILFDQMGDSRDSVSWNSLMKTYASHQLGEEVMKLFAKMQQEKDMMPNKHTFATLLSACANILALKLGKEIHGAIIRNGCEMDDVVIIGAMCDMYSKCCAFDYAIRVFKMRAHVGDIIIWNSMIFGCCHHGRGFEAVELFELMKELGVEPDHVTFQGILQACIVEGYVDQGRQYFDSMSGRYYLMPRLEHYESIVELYCRYGVMDELEEFIKTLPFEPTVLMLERCLDACQKHEKLELGEWVTATLNQSDTSKVDAGLKMGKDGRSRGKTR